MVRPHGGTRCSRHASASVSHLPGPGFYLLVIEQNPCQLPHTPKMRVDPSDFDVVEVIKY